MSLRYRPVVPSSRDGHGHALSIEVAAHLRHNVLVLGPGGETVGECTADGIISWNPRPRLHGGRVAPASVRHALAADSRLVASVDEFGVVLCFRAEHRSKSGSTPSLSGADRRHPRQSGEEWEFFSRPGRILSVGGRPHLP